MVLIIQIFSRLFFAGDCFKLASLIASPPWSSHLSCLPDQAFCSNQFLLNQGWLLFLLCFRLAALLYHLFGLVLWPLFCCCFCFAVLLLFNLLCGVFFPLMDVTRVLRECQPSWDAWVRLLILPSLIALCMPLMYIELCLSIFNIINNEARILLKKKTKTYLSTTYRPRYRMMTYLPKPCSRTVWCIKRLSWI